MSVFYWIVNETLKLGREKKVEHEVARWPNKCEE